MNITKEDIRRRMLAGEPLKDIVRIRPGQDCIISKTPVLQLGEFVVYIPDFELNDIEHEKPVNDPEEIDRILGCCYTGNDFLELVDGDPFKAAYLFHYVDWQHPVTALDDGIFDDEEDE